MTGEPLLSVMDLTVDLPTDRGMLRAVDGVSFHLDPGGVLAFVGESGCGKTMLCKALMGLCPKSAVIAGRSRIVFQGLDLVGLPERRLNRIRGREMAMIMQDPMSCLNPVLTIGRQITETIRAHLPVTRQAARRRAVDLLTAVGLADPELLIKEHPHQLSGGMRQRAALAAALACGPRLLIADEPTTSLDVTVQAAILNLLADMQKELGMAVVFVTHDLAAAASFADEIAVMYAGRIVEKAGARDLFQRPMAPYTRMLSAAVPRLEDPPHTRTPVIEGPPPDLVNPPSGCRFAPRCPRVREECTMISPPLTSAPTPGHVFACHYPEPERPCQAATAVR